MALGDEFKSSGITETTPDGIALGAGTIHKGMKCTAGIWNFAESLIGATSGGSKFVITPEYFDPEIDGANVKVAELKQKVGEVATLETNFAEITGDTIKMALPASEEATDSNATGYTRIDSKNRISKGDFLENVGYVGKTITGKPIIVIMDNALCTSGLEVEGKNKENNVMKATFECHASISSGEFEKLPWHIYYPTPAAKSVQTQAQTPAGK